MSNGTEKRWLPMVLAGANVALLASAIAFVRWRFPDDDAPAWILALQGTLLYGGTHLAALLFGMAPGGMLTRLAASATTMAVVVAGYLGVQHNQIGGAAATAQSYQWYIEDFLISVGAPWLCIAGGISLMRVLTGPITSNSQRDWAFGKNEALTLIALLALVVCGVAWAVWTNDQNEASLIDMGKVLYATPNQIAQLAGAAAFAMATAGVWRIVGFTYLVCVSLQGYMNVEPRGWATLISATGPWIYVLGNLIALRLAGYLFANSHPRSSQQNATDEAAPPAI